MRISPEEARRRLGSANNLAALSTGLGSASNVSGVSHVTKENHRGEASPIPEVIRDTMANLVVAGARGVDVAAAFDVSQGAVSNAKLGRSSSKPPNEERRAKIAARQADVKDTALTKLMQSLNLLGEDNIAEGSAKDISIVAKNMAGIVHSLTTAEDNRSAVNITVYAPQMKKQDQFKIIDV